MAKTRVKLNLRGINEVLTSAPVVSDLARRAQKIADAAGEGFEKSVNPTKRTARAYVRTADDTGRRRQAQSPVLEQAMGAGS